MIKAVDKEDRLNWFYGIFFPLFFVCLIWVVFLLDHENALHLSQYGLRPRTTEGLMGMFSMPFIHGDFNHIFNNSTSLLVLLWALFYFYRRLAFKVFGLIWVFHTFWVWLIGETGSNHIGASGLVYGLAFFLFFSGALRKKMELMGASMLIAFLYGSMIWGMFPSPAELRISWEGHLSGAIAGILLAVYFRKSGPQRKLYSFELEEQWEAAQTVENELPEENEEQPYRITGTTAISPDARPINIRYHYSRKKPPLPHPPGNEPSSDAESDEPST